MKGLIKALIKNVDYEQSNFFLSPSNKTRENTAWLTEEKRETACRVKMYIDT